MNRPNQMEIMQRIRDYQRMPRAERRQLAMERLRRAMGFRGYSPSAKPRIRCFHYRSSGKPYYAVRLVNQGRERRREIYICAERWDTLVQKLAFDQWSMLPGSRLERTWK